MVTGTHRVISVLLFASALSAAPLPERIPLRFFASRDSCRMRVQVTNAGGETVFDSDWREGNLFDWSPDLPLLDGNYRSTITTRDVDGRAWTSESTFSVQNGETRFDPPAASEPKMTTLTHDGQNGAIVTTAGDLSFRFGDLLKRGDVERMRLTHEGLIVNGTIRATGGIVFADGTVLESGAKRAPQRSAAPMPPLLIPAQSQASPRANPQSFSPSSQFKTSSTGVTIGVTNPAYRLDVAGAVGTSSYYEIGGNRFISNGGAFFNTFLGISTGNLTMTGNEDTAVGTGALFQATSGNQNTAVGDFALYDNSDASDNTAAGDRALQNNQHGSRNTALGSQALLNFVGDAGSATENTAVGYSALGTASNGVGNTAVGARSLSASTTGFQNTAVGDGALSSLTTGGGNTFVGISAGTSSNGSENTAIGETALPFSNGSGNIAIGQAAGFNLLTGDANIYIANDGNNNESNTTRIGAAQTRAFIAGIRGVTTGTANAVAVVIDSNGQLGTINSSRQSKYDIADMGARTNDLMHLRPVTFRYIAHGDDAPLQYGLIAEEVAEVYPEMVACDKNGKEETVLYQFLAPMLLNEVQQQRKTIDTLQKELTDLKEQFAAFAQRQH